MLLAVMGFCVAATNLPLRTGCDFYARCPGPVQLEPAVPSAPDVDREDI